MRRRRLRDGLLPSWFCIVCAFGLAAGLSGCAATAPDLLGGTPAVHASAGDLLISNVRALATSSGVSLPQTRVEREEAIIAQAIAEHEMRNP